MQKVQGGAAIMIASHDSYTYLPPSNPLMRMFAWLWRTQEMPIYKQIGMGVRYFDVRVRRAGSLWRICHGIVDFDLTYNSLLDIAIAFSHYRVRIILERGDDTLFRTQALSVAGLSQVAAVIIKKGWHELYRDSNHEHIVDLTYVPWHSGRSFWSNLKQFKFSSIRSNARKANAVLTPETYKTTDIVYFVDYVGIKNEAN